jgi:carbonic anhydrase/acetyltransferase-like protein (isoleucine patch superfamily)
MALFSFEGLTPQVHARAFLAPTATLVGDVIVEEGASVWYGAVIRADYAPVIVRRNANVQETPSSTDHPASRATSARARPSGTTW